MEKIEGSFTPVALDDVATDTFTLLLDAQPGLARELFRAQQCEYSYDKYHPHAVGAHVRRGRYRGMVARTMGAARTGVSTDHVAALYGQ